MRGKLRLPIAALVLLGGMLVTATDSGAKEPATPALARHVKTVDVAYGDEPVRQDNPRQKVRLRFAGDQSDRVALRALRACGTVVLKHRGEEVLPGRIPYYYLAETGRYTFVYTPCASPDRRASLQLVRLVIRSTSVDGSVRIKARRGYDYGVQADVEPGAWVYAQLFPGAGWKGQVTWSAYSGLTQDAVPFVARTALRVPNTGPLLYIARGRGLTPGTDADVRVRTIGLLPTIDAATEPTVPFPVTEPGRWMLAEMTLDEVTPHHMDVVTDTMTGEWEAFAISEDPQCSAAPPYQCDTDGESVGYLADGYASWSGPFIPFLGGPNPWVVLVMVDQRVTGTVSIGLPWGAH